jgi:hypothetical protein
MALKILILQGSEDWKVARNARRIVEEQFFDIVLVCGTSNYREILDLDKKILSIPLLEDDIYIIKILKKRESYIAGVWHQFEKDICIGGIDSKNPFQNIERLRLKRPSECRYAIILTSYMPKYVTCSRIKLLNKEVSIGLHSLLTLAKEFTKALIISCTSNIEKELCIERLEHTTLLLATKKPMTQINVDAKTLEIEVI